MKAATLRRKARAWKTLCQGLLASGILQTTAAAGVQVFSDRGLWEATLGGSIVREDFESFTEDVDFSFSTTSLPNGFSLTHVGDDSFRNSIDVPPITFSSESNGTASASLFTESDGAQPDVVTMSLDIPGIAFGFDIDDIGGGGGEGTKLEVLDPDDTVISELTLPTGMTRFVGFRADGGDRIAAVRFSSASSDNSAGGEGFFLDNVAMTQDGRVPEPTATWLVALGGACLANRRRRRKRGRPVWRPEAMATPRARRRR